MEYAPEVIAGLARQVTQVFKVALEQRLASSPKAVTIADVEKDMRELLRQMGAQALSQFLSLGRARPWPNCLVRAVEHCTTNVNVQRE